MDDLELEARLRTRLHSRFDDARVPAELASNVAQGIATTPARVGFDLRSRGRWLGWSAVAAAVALAVAAITVGPFTPAAVPGDKATPSPAPTEPAQRYFIVLPPSGAPSKPETVLASDVLGARLRALGIGTFTSGGGGGYAITFIVPADGPSDADIRAVLAATGDIEFVPLPPEDYATLEPVVGEPVPMDEPALFGWEGIESVAIDDAQQVPAITITLKPAARTAFADYTAAHTTEAFAIMLDGRVASVPRINEPIPGGQVNLSGGSLNAGPFARLAAILVGGMLPEAWRGAVVPEIISRDDAIQRARASLHDDVERAVESADLDAIQNDGRWQVTWTVVLTSGSGVMQVIVDAIREG